MKDEKLKYSIQEWIEAEHEGKMMLEEASALGHLDSTFVLGMMPMAEGRHRKQKALDMLNNAYRRANGKWNLRATCSKDGCFVRMSNTRSRRSLDDLPLKVLSRIFVVLGSESAKDIVSARLW
uniref:Uncharacterized protein n=1 Tax=Lactuca sativa TaxID=4236 RepID=A0A9R1XSC2_LACSA|nr:hypothetical protein LSAT_V11C200066300 [Lactuca sativa]